MRSRRNFHRPESIAALQSTRFARSDLSVPRNIDPAVGGLENVSLYTIDDLEGLARQGGEVREREVAACSKIVNAHDHKGSLKSELGEMNYLIARRTLVQLTY